MTSVNCCFTIDGYVLAPVNQFSRKLAIAINQSTSDPQTAMALNYGEGIQFILSEPQDQPWLQLRSLPEEFLWVYDEQNGLMNGG